MTLEETIRANMLFDAYGNLLTANQYDVLYAYISQNESLAEIASHTHTTRQAVSDLVSRAILKLENFESKLHFVERLNFVLGQVTVVASKLTNDKALSEKISVSFTNLIKSLEG